MSPTVVSLLFCIGLALLPFGAMYRPDYLGTFAASPGLIIILLAILLAPLSRPKQMPIFRQLHLSRLLLVPILGSMVSVFFLGWNPLYAIKLFSIGVLSLIWLSPLLLADFIKIKHLQNALLFGIFVCVFGYIFSDVLQILPDSIRGVIFGAAYQDVQEARPRGFSEEPSQFSATFSRLLMLYFLIKESRRRYRSTRLIGFLCVLALLLVFLGSKGAVIGIAIALLSFTMSRRQLPYFVLAMPFVVWLANTQIYAISVDIEQFSSTATRLTLLLTGIVATLANPLGWGYYGFYGAIQLFGGWSINWVSEHFPVLLIFEARDIIEELNNVSTKSTPFDFTMTFGWMFILLIVQAVQAIRLDDPRVRACLVYLFISSLSTSGHLSVTAFLILAVMLRLYPRSVRELSRRKAALRPLLA